MKLKLVHLPSLLALEILLAGVASADVFTVAYYRLGENDPGSGVGQPANAVTMDSGTVTGNLHRFVSTNGVPPTYSSDTGVKGSTLSVAFDGGGFTNSGPFALTDNWGIEAWVKAASTNNSLSSDGYANIVYNGNSANSGMGIFQTPDGRFVGLLGGITFVGGAPVVPGTWTHLAIVTSGGLTTFYVNGVATRTGPQPNAPTDDFGVGINPVGYGSGEPFQGGIDEVRVFAFAPGAFSTNDLLLEQVPPAPQAPAILSGPNVTPSGIMVPGSAFSVNVMLAGTGPFSFQWRHNDLNLFGATNATLTFTNANTNSSGTYSVVVSNAYGVVTSPPVTVAIESLTDAVTNALQYLEAKAAEMIQAAPVEMSSGIVAFPPQAGPGYAAFWLRDYNYMLEGCPTAFTTKELLDSCRLFIDAMRSDGAGVECVGFNGHVYFKPGYGTMGSNPVADGSQFTVEVAWHTYEQTKDLAFLGQIINKLVETMEAAPRDPRNGLIYIKPVGWDRCPYGFTDSVHKQGDVLFCSLLYVQACRRLANLLEAVNRPEEARQWRFEAGQLALAIRQTFWDKRIGLFRAATLNEEQPDIWGSAFAVWLGVASPLEAWTIAQYFQDHYAQIVQDGQIRELPGGLYWYSSGENFGQNGGYWATGTGWFVYTLNLADPELADQTVVDLVNDFQARGVNEWVYGSNTGVHNYMSSITMPLAGVQRMLALQGAQPQVVLGPSISPPQPLVQNGGSFSLSVTATGAAPLDFQWCRAGVPLSGGYTTSASFTNVTYTGSTFASATFSNVTSAASGIYDVVVANAYGATTSAAAAVTVLPPRANTVVPVAYYRLGENDPNAVAGQAASETVDTINGANLSVAGTAPTYAADTGVSGSMLCAAFDGGGFTNTASFALSDNWGLEAWVKPNSLTSSLSPDGYGCIAYNGDSASNGMGILQTSEGQFAGTLGGVTFLGGTQVVPGTWTHLAIVTTGGKTTFYVNCVATGLMGPMPTPSNGAFGIGFNPSEAGGGEPFQGEIDEVRIFTFAPGMFTTNDLLLGSVPPTPSISILPAAGNNVMVLWSGQELEQAGNLLGPWNRITNATAPWVLPPAHDSEFFQSVQP